jgi:hypothetical protein
MIYHDQMSAVDKRRIAADLMYTWIFLSYHLRIEQNFRCQEPLRAKL